jgi:hypothetical protein
MSRKLLWIEKHDFEGWGCSECGWVFSISGSPTGKTLEEMERNYILQRDKDFASHVCAEHTTAKKKKD